MINNGIGARCLHLTFSTSDLWDVRYVSRFERSIFFLG